MTSAAILAGGQNLRMGKNKALLEIGGTTILERIIARLRPLFEEILVIGFDREAYSPFGFPVWPDIRPGNGSMGGIHTALSRSSCTRTFCIACDMPFVHPEVVSYLVNLSGEGFDAVIPRWTAGLEPLCAVYSKNLLATIERLLDTGELKIASLLASANTRFVEAEELRQFDPRLLTFFNINTSRDLELAREMSV